MRANLPIIIQQEINSYTQYALPLCVIFQDKKYHPWIFKEFIQIISLKNHNNEGNILSYALRKKISNYFILYEMYKEIMVIESLSVDMVKNIEDKVTFLRNKINDGYYIHVFLDEYYLKSKNHYNIYHFIHPSLFYGYDDDEKKFEAIGFFKNEKFSNYKINYDEINNAINGMIFHPNLKNYYGIFTYKLKPISNLYKFTIDEFKTILFDYLNPQPDEEYIYGLDLYIKILENLNNPFSPSFYLKYNTVHLLYEHKNTFYKTLKFFFKKTDKNLICEKYKEVIEMFNNLRLVYLKYNYDKINFRVLTELSISQKIKILLNKASIREKEILTDIYNNIY